MSDVGCNSRTTSVECSHGQLCARFTDRLSGNNANCLAKCDHILASQVSSIAFCTNAMLATASDKRADLNFFNSSFNNSTCLFFCYHFIGMNDDFFCFWINNIVNSHTTINSILKFFNNKAVGDKVGNHNTFNLFACICKTILSCDNNVLSNINKTPC